VEDEFSAPARGEGRKRVGAGAFAARDFGRLLIDARGGSAGTNGSNSSKKRGRASRAAKEESDEEKRSTEEGDVSDCGVSKKRRRASRAMKEENDDDGVRRLRSVTRANSNATLGSNSGGARRSSRKRVKQEE
jgi:hypothetical protein